MHLTLLTGEYPPQPGGVGDYTHRLALTLIQRDYRVSVITLQHGQWAIYDAHQPPNDLFPDRYHLPAQYSPAHWDWHCWAAVITALDRLRPDVVHIQYQTGAYTMHPAINLLPWRLRGLGRRPGIIVTFHDTLEPYLFPKAGPLRTYVTHRLADDADHVIVTNADDAMRLAVLSTLVGRLCPWSDGGVAPTPTIIPIGSNIPVAPPVGYDRQSWRQQLGIRPDEALIAYFGLLSHSKGVDLLLDALAALQQQPVPIPQIRLLLIGGAATNPRDQAYAQEIMARIQRLALQDQVILTGHVDETTVSAHLLAADCAVLPFRDGASFRRGSLLAALAHGLPVITTHPTTPITGELPSLMHLINVLLIPSANSAALGSALQQLLIDRQLQVRLGTAARALAARFSWAEIGQYHDLIYRQVVTSHS